MPLRPQHPDALEWAESILASTPSLDFVSITAANIIGRNRSPEKDALSVWGERQDPQEYPEYLFNQAISEFASRLKRIQTGDIPLQAYPEPLATWIIKGYQGSLSVEEQASMLEEIHSQLEAASPSVEEWKVGIDLFWAYFHTTGDLTIFDLLWNHSSPAAKTYCLIIAREARYKSPVYKVMELTRNLLDLDMDESTKGRLIGQLRNIMRENKDVGGVGDRLREWAREDDRNLFQTQQLYSIMGEPGWSQYDDLLNRTILRGYLLREERIYETAREAVAAIESRLEEKQ